MFVEVTVSAKHVMRFYVTGAAVGEALVTAFIAAGFEAELDTEEVDEEWEVDADADEED